jgi:hypothetical protein
MNLITGEDLIDYAKTIQSKSEFEYFLKCFVEDYKRNRDEWENSDLLSYLEGMSNFVPSMDGYYENMNEEVDVEKANWRIIADILIAASVYGN